MTSRAVAALYDALLDYEGERRASGAYPIHKRIGFPGAKHQDVYEWLADEVRLEGTDRVLDVGCGVGFGTIYLAERGAAHVTGLTISRGEAERAARAASTSRCAGAIELVEGSFDRLPRGPFDVIVAVESLKHSTDLGRTLRSLHDALTPSGRLVVVEDVFEGDPGCCSARRIVSDWLLTRLYEESDYRSPLPPAACRVVDLTAGVSLRSPLALAARSAALNLALPWLEPARAAALRAFRGGFHLEKLYAAGMMRYVAMLWSRKGGGPR